MSDTEPTISEFKALREQLEERIFEVVMQFEDITGVEVEGIDIKRGRRIGFDSVDTITIDIITKL